VAIDMKRYQLAVCKGTDCRRNGSDRVFASARAELSARGLLPRCELYRGGCYGLCEHGPNVVLREDPGRPRDLFSREDFQLMGWPGEVHYSAMTPEKMARVVEEHVGRGAPVEALRHATEVAVDAVGRAPAANDDTY
jgi:(2Fe-2S) ferredoxin